MHSLCLYYVFSCSCSVDLEGEWGEGKKGGRRKGGREEEGREKEKECLCRPTKEGGREEREREKRSGERGLEGRRRVDS